MQVLSHLLHLCSTSCTAQYLLDLPAKSGRHEKLVRHGACYDTWHPVVRLIVSVLLFAGYGSSITEPSGVSIQCTGKTYIVLRNHLRKVFAVCIHFIVPKPRSTPVEDLVTSHSTGMQVSSHLAVKLVGPIGAETCKLACITM